MFPGDGISAVDQTSLHTSRWEVTESYSHSQSESILGRHLALPGAVRGAACYLAGTQQTSGTMAKNACQHTTRLPGVSYPRQVRSQVGELLAFA